MNYIDKYFLYLKIKYKFKQYIIKCKLKYK